MLTFKEYLVMGGNVVLDGEAANRIDLKTIKRSEIVLDLSTALIAINAAFRKMTGFALWDLALLRSRKFLSGSAFHFFNIKEIDDETFSAVKDSVGDIDIQVNGLHAEFIRKFLEHTRGQKFGDLTLLDYKATGDTYIALYKSKKYGINIQVDYELVSFEGGKPTPWSAFSRSSAWEDLLQGIKGVAHKFIFRALSAKDLKEVLILPKTPKGKEKIIVAAENTFSPSGFRVKLKPVLINGKQEIRDGRLVFQELSTEETGFVTELGAIFKAYFGKTPTPQEENAMGSFLGVLGLIKKYYTKAEQLAVANGFVNTLWSKSAQRLYRDDNERDLKEKTTMLMVLCRELGLDPRKWDHQKEVYYS